MSEHPSTSNGGVSVFGLLGVAFVAFVVLKLCGVIAWSWWWVTAPFWIPVTMIVVVFLGLLAYNALDAYLDYRSRQSERPCPTATTRRLAPSFWCLEASASPLSSSSFIL